MPLIIVTGYPSSGKSKTAQQISEFIKKRLNLKGESREVTIISDGDFLDDEGRDSTYMSITNEKQLRSFIKSETQHCLDADKIVILDAAMYIKGFRYELFCICKEAKTQYCIVEKLIDPKICWSWNEATPASVGYRRETFDALIMRYEECDDTNRWDSPLFKVRKDSDELDLEAVYDIIVEGKPLTQNKCTSIASSTTSIYKKTL